MGKINFRKSLEVNQISLENFTRKKGQGHRQVKKILGNVFLAEQLQENLLTHNPTAP